MLSFNVKEGSVPSEDVQEVLKALNKTGDRAQDISDNVLAKNHVRYMVGGNEHVENERIFRFGTCHRYTYTMGLTHIFFQRISRAAEFFSNFYRGTR